MANTQRKGYRSAESYIAKDPKKRAKQLENLTGRKGLKNKPIKADATKRKPLRAFKDDIVGFAESHFYVIESRSPIVLLEWQKVMLRDIFNGDKSYSMALLGMPKKSGKSTIAALVALYVLTSREFAEIYILGPDKEQGQLVIFDKIRKSVRMHPILKDVCTIKKDGIEYGNSSITVLI